MDRRKNLILYMLMALLVVSALAGHYLLSPWGFYRAADSREAGLRMQLVDTARSFLGAKEEDGSHRPIIDLYNSHEPLAVGYTVQYTDSWCSTFASAAAIAGGFTDIIPTECGCQRHIDLFKEMGCWEEDERRIPQPGDLIFYDWEETTAGDSTGWSDHVGIVVGSKWPLLKVIEGNCDDQVKERVIPVWDRTIRGYAKPDYTSRFR